ncbi:hypothetical protein BDV95DRAFT_260746 [Massariosphaeria phaeospora]|uniref:Uncharacterized protein n=1 Tax=Massariosphaeria phaeospora TaxID=100035 RepID=A0A7C8I196_9PLEO|nr:hypothetical protein BDV95DRAFT_260746 [Massariosphaeria phaeospora]
MPVRVNWRRVGAVLRRERGSKRVRAAPVLDRAVCIHSPCPAHTYAIPVVCCFGRPLLPQAVAVPDLCSQVPSRRCSQTELSSGSFASTSICHVTSSSLLGNLQIRALSYSPIVPQAVVPFTLASSLFVASALLFLLYILLTGAGSFPRWLRRVYCSLYTLLICSYRPVLSLHTHSSSRTALSTSHIPLTGRLLFYQPHLRQ